MTIWFTADHHAGHANIIKYCNRPFSNIEEMDLQMVGCWNEVVAPEDTIYHLGDVTMSDIYAFGAFVSQLNGNIFILPGNHDHRWLKKWNVFDSFISVTSTRKVELLPPLVNLKIEGQYITLCHYAMRVWDRSHYNAWQLYGHSHGELPPVGKQLDVGVDNHNFYPVSFEMVRTHMVQRPDNFNYIPHTSH